MAAFAPNDIETKRAVNIGIDGWCDTVRGLNCEANQVVNEIDLIRVLEKWNKENGPLFLELPFEAEAYAKTARKLR